MGVMSWHLQSGCREVKYLVLLLFKIRVLLSHGFSASSRTTWVTVREMSPLLYASSHPLRSFDTSFTRMDETFFSPRSLRVHTHGTEYLDLGESTFCLTFLSSPKYPTYTVTP